MAVGVCRACPAPQHCGVEGVLRAVEGGWGILRPQGEAVDPVTRA